MNLFNPHESVIFAYLVPGSRDFLVYDGTVSGGLYHRFLYNDKRFYYVRSQAALPARAEGYPISLTASERWTLEDLARRRGLRLRFFASQEECQQQAYREHHAQYIFDSAPPAGTIQLGAQDPPEPDVAGDEHHKLKP